MLTDKEIEANGPLSLVTCSSNHEEAGNGDNSVCSYVPECIDFSIPRRLPEEFEDPYIYFLNYSPRKEVPRSCIPNTNEKGTCKLLLQCLYAP